MQSIIDLVYILHGKRFYAIVLIVYMMKTYISLSGFDTSQILSLIVKYGIEGNDRMVLIRPKDERDKRGETTTQAVRDLSRQIDSTIKVEIYRVDHQDFEAMVLSLIDLIKSTEGEIIVNISGGPREIFLAFAIACLSQSQKIYKTTNYSDIDRTMTEVALPRIARRLDEKSNTILNDVHENPTYHDNGYRKETEPIRKYRIKTYRQASRSQIGGYRSEGQNERGSSLIYG